MKTGKLSVTLLALLAIVGGAGAARFDLAGPGTVSAVALVGLVAMIVVLRRQRSAPEQ